MPQTIGGTPPGNSGSAHYTAEIVELIHINRLAEQAYQIDAHFPAILDPQVFVASLAKNWLPRIVLVKYGAEAVGLVYTCEKVIAGLRSGVIHGDATLGNLVLANTEKREVVLGTAVDKLLESRHVRGLRFLVPPGGYEEKIIGHAAASRQLYLSPARAVWNHASLSLPSSYEEFLTSVGYRTRRNLRYYRRKAEAAGHRFVNHLSTADLAEAVDSLRTKCTFKRSPFAVSRFYRLLTAADRPLACGLRTAQGAWLSVVAGFYSEVSAMVLLQLNNDIEYERTSLSLVLRGYLIESLIRAGCNEMIFWAGLVGALAHYATIVPGTGVNADSPALVWSFVRRAAKYLSPAFPQKIQEDLAWIAPR